MNEEVRVEESTIGVAPSRLRRVSWGAIFSGVFLATVLQVMFTLLGAAIGLGPLRATEQSNPAQATAIGSGIWLLVTGLVSIWIGACVAGRLSGGPQRADGMLHGLITWSVSTVVAFWLLASTVGSVIGGAGALVNGALSSAGGAGQGGQQVMTALNDQLKSVFPHAGALLPPTGRSEGQQPTGRLTELAQQDPDLGAAVAKMEAKGGASKSEPDRDQVLTLLTSKHNMAPPDAEKLVNDWDQQFQQAKGHVTQQARETGQQVAKGAAQGAFWGFLALFLGLLVSAWGGWAGTSSLPRPT